jgi:uncharacterized protein YdiU (UPF0061 family)
VKRLLAAMRDGAVDFTLVFRRLHDASVRALFPEASPIDAWLHDWRLRLQREDSSPAARAAAMDAVNPAFIARNHRVAAALHAATYEADFAPFERLLQVLQQPFAAQPAAAEYMQPPEEAERVLQTFCGT